MCLKYDNKTYFIGEHIDFLNYLVFDKKKLIWKYRPSRSTELKLKGFGKTDKSINYT